MLPSQPTRWWRRPSRRQLRAVLRASRSVLPGRDTPVTAVVVVVLALVTVAMRMGSPADADIAQWASTNLVNLHRHPVTAMVASIFVVPDGVSPDVMVFPVAGAVLERRVGSMRLVAIALVGHVVATLVTEGAVRLAIDSGTDARSAAWQLDVGVSYVVFTVSACAVRLCPRPWRRPALAGLLGWVLVPVLLRSDMTSWGHVLSVAIGVLSWHWIPTPAAECLDHPSGPPEPVRRIATRRARVLSGATIACLAVVGTVVIGTGRLLPRDAGPAHPRAHRADRTWRVPGTGDVRHVPRSASATLPGIPAPGIR